MHEYAIIGHLMEHLDSKLRAKGITKVAQIKMRRSSIFSEGPLLQSFQILAKDTVLSDATLEIEEFQSEQDCYSCGSTNNVTTDDLIGHLYFCPACGTICEIDEGQGLEITGILIPGSDTPIMVDVKPHAHHDH